jgi:GNAT superfamily N-acetyltransferase
MGLEPSGIVTRAASTRDVHAIAVFQSAVWNEAYSGLVPQSYLDRATVAERELRWADRIGRRDMLLAEIGAELVAVASCSLRTDARTGPRLELNTLYVAAGIRGRGLGSG